MLKGIRRKAKSFYVGMTQGSDRPEADIRERKKPIMPDSLSNKSISGAFGKAARRELITPITSGVKKYIKGVPSSPGGRPILLAYKALKKRISGKAMAGLGNHANKKHKDNY